MSVEKPRFWSRVGHWFRAPSRADGVGLETETDVALGVAAPRSGDGDPSDHSLLSPDGSGLMSRLRWPARETSLARLQEDYNKVLGLVESIQRHLEVQEQRSASIAQSLERLAASLAHLPESSAAHRDILGSIGNEVESQTVVLQRLEDGLSQLPNLADAQRETMAVIGRQLDSTRQTGDRVIATLDGFQHAVSKLGDATTASTTVFREVHADASAREERMVAMLQEQTRRFTVFAMAAICVAVLAGVCGLVALLR